jgi:CBS domain-containing protein
MSSVLLNKASKPAFSVPREITVLDAVRLMVDKRVGAALIVDDGRPAGIFTERDLMNKVVAQGKDPAHVRIGDVMTSPVVPIHATAEVDDAVRLMIQRHIRHLPLVDPEGKVLGMLSIRHLMADEIDSLRHAVSGLEAYAGYDGGGG